MTAEGWYVRALSGVDGLDIIEAKQIAPDQLEVRVVGAGGGASVETLIWMLGTDIDLRPWYQRVKAIPWLAYLSSQLRGLKPPRYPNLWEALCHGILFQQLSIASAASIMKRLVERFSVPLEHRGVQLYPFPSPQAIVEAEDSVMRALGLSTMKISYLKTAATAMLDGRMSNEHIRSLSTSDARAELMRLRGIGPWSASNVMLRGFGSLDTFPMRDTGVAASIALLSGNKQTDADALLEELGDLRGLLYFHLLLGARALRAGVR